MLVFPASKINLGLHIVNKREDGFHNIETVFYKTGWRDALEVVLGQNEFELMLSGLKIDGTDLAQNIVYKAYKLLSLSYKIPPIKVYLHKNIPMGAGLGGGSSDAAYFIKAIDQKFNLNIPKTDLHAMAAELGSDCAFFMEHGPVYATQKGNVFEPVKVDLKAYYFLMIYPGIHSNTREAYEGITPAQSKRSIKEIVEQEPIPNWKACLFNDFETTIFKKYPAIGQLKEKLYDSGALYASLSGSGSAVYGIYKEKPSLELSKEYLSYLQEPHK